MTVEYLIKQLGLSAHPEGGYYRETYRSESSIIQVPGQTDFPAGRSFATAIYFLIEKSNFSALHKIRSDETWHFYAGDPLEVIEIDEKGTLIFTSIGNNPGTGDVFQYTVKANRWFGSRVKQGGSFSLVGCTVSPGFDFRDFEMGSREELTEKFPDHKTLIAEMTRD